MNFQALTPTEKDAVLSNLFNMVDQLRQARGEEQRKVSYQNRVLAMNKLAAKDRAVHRALQTEGGLKRIAAQMANPVRFFLDYKGISRKLVVVEQIPDGVPIIYDKDLPRVPALKIGPEGSVRAIEMKGTRVEIDAFEIVARPKIPYKELYTRRFRALNRAKDRLVEGLELREDLLWFGLIEAASELFNTPVNVTGTAVNKQDLSIAFAEVEKWRLVCSSVLMSVWGTRAIRSWQFQNLDQIGMIQVRETGYLGSMWGADFYVSDQIEAGTYYVLAQPKFLGWQPIRKDLEIIPADDPDNLQLGFVGYILEGMTLFNPRGVAKVVNPDYAGPIS